MHGSESLSNIAKLHQAIKNNNELKVKELLADDLYINEVYEGFTALYLAIKSEHTDIALLLLDNEDIDPNVRTDSDDTALHMAADIASFDAIDGEYQKIIERLIEKGAKSVLNAQKKFPYQMLLDPYLNPKAYNTLVRAHNEEQSAKKLRINLARKETLEFIEREAESQIQTRPQISGTKRLRAAAELGTNTPSRTKFRHMATAGAGLEEQPLMSEIKYERDFTPTEEAEDSSGSDNETKLVRIKDTRKTKHFKAPEITDSPIKKPELPEEMARPKAANPVTFARFQFERSITGDTFKSSSLEASQKSLD